MFSGNKPVLILPGILMIIMFIGGYYFLGDTDTFTNEELKEVIEVDVQVDEQSQGLRIQGEWDWTIMPSEGIYGDDYISVFIESDESFSIETAELKLLYAGDVIEETAGKVVENGVIFSFSNQLVEQISYGNSGEFEVVMSGENVKAEDISIRYLHTWTNHLPLDLDDASFQDPTFGEAENVPYWILIK
ncbi:hypothetical protein [Bacillus suaedae]|uniref:Uncharacterized protein n=1 Tax=Halalkalibacter suaedae TaxID=2822140 RepID=A0A940WV67_9BACI|nr:hypothetical protein [Bacillus suaedae]MBP3951227.1 hypothetical protein [Bacillus suaedae]